MAPKDPKATVAGCPSDEAIGLRRILANRAQRLKAKVGADLPQQVLVCLVNIKEFQAGFSSAAFPGHHGHAVERSSLPFNGQLAVLLHLQGAGSFEAATPDAEIHHRHFQRGSAGRLRNLCVKLSYVPWNLSALAHNSRSLIPPMLKRNLYLSCQEAGRIHDTYGWAATQSASAGPAVRLSAAAPYP